MKFQKQPQELLFETGAQKFCQILFIYQHFYQYYTISKPIKEDIFSKPVHLLLAALLSHMCFS